MTDNDGVTRRDFLRGTLAVAAVGGTVPSYVPQQNHSLPWYRRAYRWGQTNITEKDPIRYDIAWWRGYWKRTETQAVVINAGGIVAYYPSRFPLHHRAEFLNGRDLFGELTKAAHDDGLFVMARMDSNRAAEDFFTAHPDWFARDAQGQPYRAADKYVACINSAYYDEYLPAVMQEIVERSHPDGFTDNSWAGLGRESICYCVNCQRKFPAGSGHALPKRADWSDKAYREWIMWSYARRIEIWELNNRTTRAAGGPDCIWAGMNSGSVTTQSRSFRDLREISRRADMMMLDHQRRDDDTGFQQNGDTGKRVHMLLGWDKVAPESMAMYQSGPGYYRVASKPAAEARMWMIAGIAGGIQPWWHHVGAYHEDRRMYRSAEPIARWCKKHEQYLVNRQPVATVGVVWSQRNTDFFGRDEAGERVDAPYTGFMHALVRARIPYLPIHADDIDADGRHLRVLILPNVGGLSDAQIASIRRFVQRGGSLFATGATSLYDEWGDPRSDFALADLFRCHTPAAAPQLSAAGRREGGVHTYLRLAPELRARVDGPKAGDEPSPAGERHQVLRGFEETDLLPFGGSLTPLRVEPSATVPLTFVPAFPTYPPETAWMREPKSDIPALVLSQHGASRVAFMPADIDRRYAREHLPDHATLLANLVRWLDAGGPLTVEGTGLVDCHLYEQPGRTILHMVNLTSEATWRAPLHELIRVGPFKVSVGRAGGPGGQGAGGPRCPVQVARGRAGDSCHVPRREIRIRSRLDPRSRSHRDRVRGWSNMRIDTVGPTFPPTREALRRDRAVALAKAGRSGVLALAGSALVVVALAGVAPVNDKPSVVFVGANALEGPARHGVSKLREALHKRGFDVVERSKNPRAAIVSFTVGCRGVTEPEALTVRRSVTQSGSPAVALCGSDARGSMYAALDTAERVTWSTNSADPFDQVRSVSERPFLAERGISMYTMHRAYFESRLFDERHWQRYFDMLAASRINSFVVIFGYENGGFMAPLYPYFFDVEEFPDVKMAGLTPREQSRNAAAFKSMIRIAHERGIRVTAGIWDHIYRGGVQTGGIPGAPKSADERIPGLVWGVTGQNLPSYTKAALRKFLRIFPEIDAIQFRMHEESGLTKNEMVGFWHEVFTLIKQARPDLKLDLRAKGLPDEVIDDALKQGLDARVSTKFWMEQLGLPFHPTHVNPQNQKDRRHGYADLLKYPQRYRVHWQVWSGGTTRLLLWGDPDYVRRFAHAARLYDGNSFEVNEMLATKMLGEPHGDRPIDILSPRYRYYEYEFERYWHFYQVWGRLTYDPQAPSEIWEREFARRFGSAAPHVMKAQHLASRVLPRIVASTYRYAYFPTTRGWAEMKRQDDLPTFAGLEGSDTQQFMSPRDAARSIMSGSDTAMRRPEETSRWFAETADTVLSEAAAAEKASATPASNELRSTLTDFRILASLARYYAARLPAAVAYDLYKESGDLAAFDSAIDLETRAIDAWGGIVAAAGDVYSEKLPFGAPGHFPRHWREELQALQRDFDKLVVARRSATARPGATPTATLGRHVASDEPMGVSAIVVPVTEAVPGRDVTVVAGVRAPAGVKSVRLRYRHATQFEDYQTVDMTLDSQQQYGDPARKSYIGRIPASFIDPKWDLMYFVEVVDARGTGRMFPDLDRETPYVMVRVKR